MNRKTAKLFIVLPVSLLLLAVMLAGLGGLSAVQARTIVIDASDDWDDAGWEMDPPNQPNLGHIGRNTRWEGEYIWTDNQNDHIATLPGSQQADILAFRITADADNLYFYIQMQDILTSTGLGAPMVQVSIDTDRQVNSGEVEFAGNADTSVYSGTAASAQWEYLVNTRFGSGNSNAMVYTATAGGSTWNPVYVGSAAISVTAETIEFSVPWTALGMTEPPTLPLRFSVASFLSDASDNPIEDAGAGSASDAIDAVTNYADPGDASNTSAETGDNVVDYYFDLFFEPDGDIYPPLLISEVLYDPSGDEPDDEFIELYNISPITLELGVAATGRTFKVGDEETIDSNGGAESMAEFAFGSSIGPGKVVVIARDGNRFNGIYGFLPDFEFEWASAATNMFNYAEWDSDSILQIQLANGGDEVLLLDPSDTVLDVVEYEDSSPEWPGLSGTTAWAGNGNSLERYPAGVDTNHIDNDFTYHTGNGDPGNVRDVNLILSKSVTPTAVLPGKTLTYTVVFSNSGDAPAAGTVFTDALPAQVTFARWITQPSGALESGGVITWGGALTQNTAITFTFVVTNNAAGQIVTNTARYLYPANASTGSAAVTYTALPVYTLTFVYHDEEDVAQGGDSVLLSGEWNNWLNTTMTADAGNTVFTSTVSGVPGGRYEYVYRVQSGGVYSAWLNFPGRRVVTVTADALVHDYRNVHVAGAKLNGPPALTINLGQNSGDIYGQVHVPGSTPGVGQGRGIAAQLGYGANSNYPNWNWATITYDSSEPLEDVYKGVITPVAGGVYSYAVRFDPNWGANNPNKMWAYGDLNGGVFSLNQSGVLTVTAPALSISKTAQPAHNVSYRGNVTYTIVLSNTGDGDASSLLLTDTLPSGVSFARWVTQPSGAAENAGVISWNGALTAAHSLTFTFIVSHTGNYGDVITNTAQFTHSSGNGSAEALFNVEGPPPDISIVSPANGAAFTAADGISVTIPVTVSVSNFTMPTDGHWHLWVDGVMKAMLSSTGTTTNLLTGTRVISAQLVDTAHQPIGPVDTVTVTVNAPQPPVTYSVRVTRVGSGTVALDHANGIYNDGETAYFTATAESGWHFSGWSGDLSGASPTATLVITGDKLITATFEQDVSPPVTYTLSVNITGNGQVDLNPSGSQGSGTMNFASSYTAGTTVTLTATPDEGWRFSGWSGNANGTAAFPLLMDADKIVTATFELEQHKIYLPLVMK